MKHYHYLNKGRLLLTFILLTIFGTGGSWALKKPPLKNGIWRAELQRAVVLRIVLNF